MLIIRYIHKTGKLRRKLNRVYPEIYLSPELAVAPAIFSGPKNPENA